MLDNLFNCFLKELEYLKGVSKATIKSYRLALTRYKIACGDELPTKENLSKFVVSMRERGLSPVTCNISIRAFNSFLTYLEENGHPRLRIKKLKEDQKRPQDIQLESLKRLLNCTPSRWVLKRVWTLVIVLMDTGCRIDEILTLKRSRIDLDNCLMEVTGKGRKDRVIPISNEIRRILYNYLKPHKHELVFCTKDGEKLGYFNVRRDFRELCADIRIDPIPFHRLRHNYALNFIRNGGDVFSLKRILGHSALQTTMLYVNSSTDDLKMIHNKTSILERLK